MEGQDLVLPVGPVEMVLSFNKTAQRGKAIWS